MRFKTEKEEADKLFRVESINTGRWWGFDTMDEVKRFFHGRNIPFYKLMKTVVYK